MTILTNTEPIMTRKMKSRARRAVTLSTKITSRELELMSVFEADGRALGVCVREAKLKVAHSSSTGVGADPHCQNRLFTTPFGRGHTGPAVNE
jgi:hypothetical protein